MKVDDPQQLRDMLKLQQTPADEGKITDQEEERKSHLKEENKRDMKPLLVIKEESLHEQQECNLSVDQEDMKEEEEEKLWISQQLEEADLTKFGFTAVRVKSESDDEEKPEPSSSSQLHQSPRDDITEAEPVASSSSGHRTLRAEDDGEDHGGPQAARNSGPNSHLLPDTSERSSDSSGTETDDSYDWKQNRKLQSSFNWRKNTSIVQSGNTDEEEFKDSSYVKASGHMYNSEQQNESNGSIKAFGWSDWSKKQKQKRTLDKHVIIQTGQKPFGCSECGQRFGLKSNLNRHITIHTGQKAFVCSKCDKRFGRKSHLSRHMIIHTGQKAFVCSDCGQRFGQKSTLNTHMIIHTGQKAFVCSECGQGFGQKSNLTKHMIIHTGQKLFVCSECGQRFGRKANLTRHMMIHTGHTNTKTLK